MSFAFDDTQTWLMAPAPYVDWPEPDDRAVCLAFLEAFTGVAGRAVLHELYRLQQQLPSAHELRPALNIVFPYLVDTVRRGKAYEVGQLDRQG